VRIPRFALRETVSIENFVSSGSRGAVYAEATEQVAQVEPVSQLITDDDGRIIAGNYYVIIRPEVGNVPLESRLTWKGQKYRVVQSVGVPSERRPTHRELIVVKLT